MFVGKYSDWPYKLYYLVLQSDDRLDYIKRRPGLYFIVRNRPLALRFSKSSRDIHKSWKSLERMGAIYNLSFEYGAAKFNLRLPSYLKVVDE